MPYKGFMQHDQVQAALHDAYLSLVLQLEWFWSSVLLSLVPRPLPLGDEAKCYCATNLYQMAFIKTGFSLKEGGSISVVDRKACLHLLTLMCIIGPKHCSAHPCIQ